MRAYLILALNNIGHSVDIHKLNVTIQETTIITKEVETMVVKGIATLEEDLTAEVQELEVHLQSVQGDTIQIVTMGYVLSHVVEETTTTIIIMVEREEEKDRLANYAMKKDQAQKQVIKHLATDNKEHVQVKILMKSNFNFPVLFQNPKESRGLIWALGMSLRRW